MRDVSFLISGFIIHCMESNFIKPHYNSYLEDYANENFGYSGLGEIRFGGFENRERGKKP